MILPRVIAPLLAAFLLAGCSGGAASGADPVRTTTVDLPPSYQFAPTAIQVPVGATVTWTNNDHFTHSVLVAGTDDVHNMKPGEKTTITFDKAGEYNYVCTYHTQDMKGKVIVG
jgi:plastocyanin